MLNRFKLIFSLFGFVLFLDTALLAQERRVLVVPFDQFQFESSVALEEIAEFNEWKEVTSVYENYNKAILSYLNQAEDSILYFVPASSELMMLRNRLPKIYKREPVSHFGVEISPLLEDSSFFGLMENMGADYILFISRYKLMGKLVATRSGSQSSGKFLSWSMHLVDYEIYDKKGELAGGADRFPFTPHNPTSQTYSTRGTLVSGLERPSKKMAKDIAYKLERFEKKGKVVFKNKVK